MPKYKLTYFNIRARAEVARMLFALAGVQYEDIRLPRVGDRAEWNALKPNTPFGQIPTLEVDGKILCQSHVIEEYLAREFGFAGKTSWDQARAAMITNCVEDTFRPCRAAFLEPDEEQKKEKIKKVQEQLPDYLNKLERFLMSNNGGDGYFVGDGLTYADLVFYQLMFLVEKSSGMKIDWNKWIKLKNLRSKIESHPKIAEWFKNRPAE